MSSSRQLVSAGVSAIAFALLNAAWSLVLKHGWLLVRLFPQGWVGPESFFATRVFQRVALGVSGVMTLLGIGSLIAAAVTAIA